MTATGLKELSELLKVDGKIVTVRFLSLHLNTPIPKAQALLSEFAEKRTLDGLSVSYKLCGWKSVSSKATTASSMASDSGDADVDMCAVSSHSSEATDGFKPVPVSRKYCVSVVSDSKLDSAKAQFDEVTRCDVYSIYKGIHAPMTDASLIADSTTNDTAMTDASSSKRVADDVTDAHHFISKLHFQTVLAQLSRKMEDALARDGNFDAITALDTVQPSAESKVEVIVSPHFQKKIRSRIGLKTDSKSEDCEDISVKPTSLFSMFGSKPKFSKKAKKKSTASKAAAAKTSKSSTLWSAKKKSGGALKRKFGEMSLESSSLKNAANNESTEAPSKKRKTSASAFKTTATDCSEKKTKASKSKGLSIHEKMAQRLAKKKAAASSSSKKAKKKTTASKKKKTKSSSKKSKSKSSKSSSKTSSAAVSTAEELGSIVYADDDDEDSESDDCEMRGNDSDEEREALRKQREVDDDIEMAALSPAKSPKIKKRVSKKSTLASSGRVLDDDSSEDEDEDGEEAAAEGSDDLTVLNEGEEEKNSSTSKKKKSKKPTKRQLQKLERERKKEALLVKRKERFFALGSASTKKKKRVKKSRQYIDPETSEFVTEDFWETEDESVDGDGGDDKENASADSGDTVHSPKEEASAESTPVQKKKTKKKSLLPKAGKSTRRKKTGADVMKGSKGIASYFKKA